MSRTILLVEDDEGIAGMLQIALGRYGYRVLHASDSRSAVEMARNSGEEIGVVVCDVVLPDGPGPEALVRIRRQRPNTEVVFTSGYPFDVLIERGLISPELLREWNALYLPKPFLPHDIHVVLSGAFRQVEANQARSESHVERRDAYAASAC